MPTYHVHLNYVGKGAAGGGAPGFQRYLARADLADGFRRYLWREAGHGQDDLVAYGEAHLPGWARDGAHFWQEAERRERAKGPVFWHLQVALPRELSPTERRELADDIREVMVGRYPHVWAMHEPEARDGSGFQPHMHLQFSSRRDRVEREGEVGLDDWFRQAPRGVAKDASWFAKGRLYDIRDAVELLTNAALSRAGIEAAVSARRLSALGFERPVAIYGQGTQQTVMEYRRTLQESGQVALEHLTTYAGWQKHAQKLLSLDRQYVTDLCRDHVWRFDRSQAREEEREASMQRTLALAAATLGPRLVRPREAQDRQGAAAQHRQRMQAIRARHQEPQAGAALHIRLFEDEHERQRQRQQGMSW